MKKILIVLLCLVLTVSLFSGCIKKDKKKEIKTNEPGKVDTIEADPININGLDSGDATNEQIAEAMGREPDAAPILENGGELLIYNDVIWLTVLFHQVQYSRSEDHMLVTYCYTLDGDETMEDALENLRLILNREYGDGGATIGEPPMYTWQSAETGNNIRLYALNETEIRLQYSLANPE
ncbi:MAG: hypothetical protein MJ085_03115 [Clostridia bacterium]|nr:hypothetical protein [Clostridia bacterium]